MKAYLKGIIRLDSGKKHSYFSMFIQAMILLSVISFTIETATNLAPSTRHVLHAIEIFCIVIFTLEYGLRIYLADNKFKYLFSFFGIIDLLSILPFYLALSVDLRSLRALRFLRLFSIFKLVGYNRAVAHLVRAFVIAKEEIAVFLFSVCILIYLSAVGVYYFEHNAQPAIFSSVFDSLWWAVITLTTVGYGDAYPITNGGRLFTFFILIVGIGIIAIPAGIISSALTKTIDQQR